MPDWCLPIARCGYNALWLEFKRPKQKPTPEQLEVHRSLEEWGGLVYVVTDAQAALELVLGYVANELPARETLV